MLDILIQSIDVDKDEDKKYKPLAPQGTSACVFKGDFCAYAISSTILCSGPYSNQVNEPYHYYIIKDVHKESALHVANKRV